MSRNQFGRRYNRIERLNTDFDYYIYCARTPNSVLHIPQEREVLKYGSMENIEIVIIPVHYVHLNPQECLNRRAGRVVYMPCCHALV